MDPARSSHTSVIFTSKFGFVGQVRSLSENSNLVKGTKDFIIRQHRLDLGEGTTDEPSAVF